MEVNRKNSGNFALCVSTIFLAANFPVTFRTYLVKHETKDNLISDTRYYRKFAFRLCFSSRFTSIELNWIILEVFLISRDFPILREIIFFNYLLFSSSDIIGSLHKTPSFWGQAKYYSFIFSLLYSTLPCINYLWEEI